MVKKRAGTVARPFSVFVKKVFVDVDHCVDPQDLLANEFMDSL